MAVQTQQHVLDEGQHLPQAQLCLSSLNDDSSARGHDISVAGGLRAIASGSLAPEMPSLTARSRLCLSEPKYRLYVLTGELPPAGPQARDEPARPGSRLRVPPVSLISLPSLFIQFSIKALEWDGDIGPLTRHPGS